VRLGLGRSFQITAVLREFTALDNVALARPGAQGHSFRFLADARKRPARCGGRASAASTRSGSAHAPPSPPRR
jgi:branched-chain amino acid transport system ATP-binding protein